MTGDHDEGGVAGCATGELAETSESPSAPPVPSETASPAYRPPPPPPTLAQAESPPLPATQKEPASECDPNYTRDCVPIASDVDCAGGSGNGPAYVQGPVYVVDEDIHDLDRDGDGVGCDS